MNSSLKAWMRALEMTARIERERKVTLPCVIDQLGERFAEAPALTSPKEVLTYRGLAEASRRYARWGLAQGFGPGDVLGLLMPNRPQYMACWLGLSRIGVVVALLNTHARGDSLVHAIQIVRPRGIIVDAALAGALASVRQRLPAEVRCWVYGAAGDAAARDGTAPDRAAGDHAADDRAADDRAADDRAAGDRASGRDAERHCGAPREAGAIARDLPRLDVGLARLDVDLAGFPADPLSPSECAFPSLDDRALYIYTSGTTGLPKAAVVTHYRVMQWSHWFAGMMNTGPQDRMYDCLPMYHSVGGVVATGATLIGGGTVVVRERFSASELWQDVAAERCTLFQYIGELCRYLLASPPHPDEARHALRLCCGNGLRAEVWEPFRQRFRIPQILEYYASTEGSFSLYNCEGRPGAVGRIPPFLSHRMPVALVRFDERTEMPWRDAAGRCVRCVPGEVGEAIGQLRDAEGKPVSRFEGYADSVASERKVLRDVFAPGDAWYRTGDLMRQDAQGFFYFVDRVGDTFRWKGENVSTSEVAAVISACQGVLDAAVYGVSIPGMDGRAGMAALVAEAGFDLAALRAHLAGELPEYARPVFVRLVPRIERTGTFKLQKRDLARQGFDPAQCVDEIYFDDRRRGAYVRLDATLAERIRTGQIRV